MTLTSSMAVTPRREHSLAVVFRGAREKIRPVRGWSWRGTELPAGARFCLQCGQPVGAPPLSASPASYTPTHIAEKELARARLEAAAQRGLTQFVGRTVELAQLGDALDRARLGDGQVVGVVGEAGRRPAPPPSGPLP